MNNKTKSTVMLSAAMLIFGTIGIFRRYIPLPSAALACFRGAAGTAFLLLAALLQKRRLAVKISARTLLLTLLSGVAMGFNWICLFEAYTYTTVSTATLCYYMQPTMIMLLSPLLFHERLILKKGCCTVIALIGMLFVSGVPANGIPTLAEAKGILLGLAAAALYAAVVIINKKTPEADAYQKTVLQLASAAVVLLPYTLLFEQPSAAVMTPLAVLLLLTVGFVHTGAAYALYFGSMKALSVQTVAVFSYLDPIAALILSAAVLGETLSVLEAIGAVMIIGAAMASELTLKKRSGATLKGVTGEGERKT